MIHLQNPFPTVDWTGSHFGEFSTSNAFTSQNNHVLSSNECCRCIAKWLMYKHRCNNVYFHFSLLHSLFLLLKTCSFHSQLVTHSYLFSHLCQLKEANMHTVGHLFIMCNYPVVFFSCNEHYFFIYLFILSNSLLEQIKL